MLEPGRAKVLLHRPEFPLRTSAEGPAIASTTSSAWKRSALPSGTRMPNASSYRWIFASPVRYKDLSLRSIASATANPTSDIGTRSYGQLGPFASELSQRFDSPPGSTNPLRILDIRTLRDLSSGRQGDDPDIIRETEHPTSFTRWDRVIGLLQKVDVPLTVDGNLVSGIRLLHRIRCGRSPQAGWAQQNAVGGGGRYDDLVEPSAVADTRRRVRQWARTPAHRVGVAAGGAAGFAKAVVWIISHGDSSSL